MTPSRRVNKGFVTISVRKRIGVDVIVCVGSRECCVMRYNFDAYSNSNSLVFGEALIRQKHKTYYINKSQKKSVNDVEFGRINYDLRMNEDLK